MTVPLLDKMVWQDIASILHDPKRFIEEARKRFEQYVHHDTLEGLHHRVKQLEQQEANIRKAIQFAETEDAIAPFMVDLNNLQAQRQRALADIKQLQHDQIAWEASYNRIKHLVTALKGVDRAEQYLTYQQKRSFLSALTVRVTVYPQGGEYRYRISAGLHGEIVFPNHPAIAEVSDTDCVYEPDRPRRDPSSQHSNSSCWHCSAEATAAQANRPAERPLCHGTD